MVKFLTFSRDIFVQGIGFWIVPWFGITYLAFQIYHQVKERSGFEDFGLGWPLVVLALMLTFGHLVFGARFQAIYERHFPEGK